jgi:quercetin 2,3-dioxygenase
MVTIRKNNDRGKTITDWLTSYHSFSFNHYYDPAHVNFGPLVVLNDETIQPGKGFGLHQHENMEIVTYVLEGALEHKESTGESEILRAGEVGRMSAGTGIAHSEYNHSLSELVHFTQVWFIPKHENTVPSHEQKNFSLEQRLNIWLPIASDNVALGGTMINADATMLVSRLEQGHSLQYEFLSGHGGYFHIAEGIVVLNGKIVGAGDAAALSFEPWCELNAVQNTEIIGFSVQL